MEPECAMDRSCLILAFNCRPARSPACNLFLVFPLSNMKFKKIRAEQTNRLNIYKIWVIKSQSLIQVIGDRQICWFNLIKAKSHKYLWCFIQFVPQYVFFLCHMEQLLAFSWIKYKKPCKSFHFTWFFSFSFFSFAIYHNKTTDMWDIMYLFNRYWDIAV